METQTEQKIERPQSYENERLDCTVRAFSLASNIPYPEVHLVFKQCGRKDKHRFFVDKEVQKISKILNVSAKQIKRSGSVKSFIIKNPTGNFFCMISGHCFPVIDGVVHDISKLDSHIKEAWLITKEVAQ